MEVAFFFIGLFVGVIIAFSVGCAAYRNGVTDGYGYSREPNCPGYAAAGKYLRENMAYRWPELRLLTPRQLLDRKDS